jgi:orotate phosphoribosyltransferase
MRERAVHGLSSAAYRLHALSLAPEQRGWHPYTGDPVHDLEIHQTAADAHLDQVFRDSLFARAAPSRLADTRERRELPGMDWILDTRVALSRGERLRPVGEAMARRLERCEARQIAGRGYGSFLLIGATLAADERLRGALVRDAPKDRGTRRQIEGDLDPSEPVFVVDDVLSSGNSAATLTHTLREHGLRVRGGVFVFAYQGRPGPARLGALGFEVIKALAIVLAAAPAPSTPQDPAPSLPTAGTTRTTGP